MAESQVGVLWRDVAPRDTSCSDESEPKGDPEAPPFAEAMGECVVACLPKS
jgi:hypothetical protein